MTLMAIVIWCVVVRQSKLIYRCWGGILNYYYKNDSKTSNEIIFEFVDFLSAPLIILRFWQRLDLVVQSKLNYKLSRFKSLEILVDLSLVEI